MSTYALIKPPSDWFRWEVIGPKNRLTLVEFSLSVKEKPFVFRPRSPHQY
jgi:hypothetical protein